MEKAVLISIRPEYTDKILSGKKTVEVRKRIPKLDPPYRCYIYQTFPKYGDWNDRDGKIVGEFVCDCVFGLTPISTAECGCVSYLGLSEYGMEQTCLTVDELVKYGNGKNLHGLDITDVKAYKKPLQLTDFKPWNRECFYSDLGLAKPKCEECHDCKVKKAPQSWCYVESIER